MRTIPWQAARQQGVFTSQQAMAAGWSVDQLKRAVGSGRLSRPRRGIYALVGPTESAPAAARQWFAQLGIAAAMRVPAAIVSHATAVALHDLPLLDTPTTPCLTLPPELRTREAAIHLHRQPIPTWQLVDLAAVKVTSVARSCIDLTRETGLDAGIVAADAALQRGLCTVTDLEQVYAGCRGRAGLPSGRQLFELIDSRSESALESISRLALRSLQPIPRSQVTVRTPIGRFLARVDFYWDGLGVVGEADGQLKYTDQQLWQEKLRQDRLAEHGLVVVRWGWAEARKPAVLQARIKRACRRAAQLRSAGIPITAAIS